MADSNTPKAVLLILGMHRSGTSLTANWLHQCGLYLGEDLVGPDIGNQFGHYENKDFLNLHIQTLRQMGADFFPASSIYSKIPDSFNQKAKGLIEKNNALHDQWGWKEPRTCLFIRKWHELLPNIKVLVVFRHYELVVDSLIRRYEKLILRQNSFLRKNIVMPIKRHFIAEKYARSWVTHNRELLDYIKLKNREDVLVVSIENLIAHDDHVFNHLRNTWEMGLTQASIDSILNQKELNSLAGKVRRIKSKTRSEALSIMGELRALEEQYNANDIHCAP